MASLRDVLSDAARRPGNEVVAQSRSRCGLDLAGVDRNFIFNMDLDGVISALLLREHLKWTPIGVCACNGGRSDAVWVHQSAQAIPAGTTFVDMWVVPPSYPCIDQHVVAVDPGHWNRLAATEGKLNPNLLWPCIASSADHGRYRKYALKYPFGVAHFIIAALEAIGKLKELPTNRLGPRCDSWDLLLRADDAQRSTAKEKYRSNAIGWWEYLEQLGGCHIAFLANRCVERDLKAANRTQAAVEGWIKSKAPSLKWLTKDGGFSRHYRAHGYCESMDDLCAAIGDAIGIDGRGLIPKDVSMTQLVGSKGPPDSLGYVAYTLEDEALFSYAVTGMSCCGFSSSALPASTGFGRQPSVRTPHPGC